MASRKDSKLRGILKKHKRSLETLKARLSRKDDLMAYRELYTPIDKPRKRRVTWKKPLNEYFFDNLEKLTENSSRKIKMSKENLDPTSTTEAFPEENIICNDPISDDWDLIEKFQLLNTDNDL